MRHRPLRNRIEPGRGQHFAESPFDVRAPRRRSMQRLPFEPPALPRLAVEIIFRMRRRTEGGDDVCCQPTPSCGLDDPTERWAGAGIPTPVPSCDKQVRALVFFLDPHCDLFGCRFVHRENADRACFSPSNTDFGLCDFLCPSCLCKGPTDCGSVRWQQPPSVEAVQNKFPADQGLADCLETRLAPRLRPETPQATAPCAPERSAMALRHRPSRVFHCRLPIGIQGYSSMTHLRSVIAPLFLNTRSAGQNSYSTCPETIRFSGCLKHLGTMGTRMKVPSSLSTSTRWSS